MKAKDIEKIDVELLKQQLEQILDQLQSASQINAILELKETLNDIDIMNEFSLARQQVLACANLLEPQEMPSGRNRGHVRTTASREPRTDAGKPRPLRKINEILNLSPNKWHTPEDVYEKGKEYFEKIGIRQTEMMGYMSDFAEKKRIQGSSGKYKALTAAE